MNNPDENKSDDYIRRRDWLLERMKKERWEIETPAPTAKKGRKPKEQPKPTVDPTKPRNKNFFNFD